MEQPTKPKGRPPKPPEQRLIQRSIRLTAAQWAKVESNGIDWLRRLITRARS
jgi:hypothetical protein